MARKLDADNCLQPVSQSPVGMVRHSRGSNQRAPHLCLVCTLGRRARTTLLRFHFLRICTFTFHCSNLSPSCLCAADMSTPGGVPPPTPGPNRVHRPREDHRYTPYEPVIFPTRALPNNENRVPSPPACPLSPSPFTDYGTQPTSQGAAYLTPSHATNVTPSTLHAGPVSVKIDRLLHTMDMWSAKDDVYKFSEVRYLYLVIIMTTYTEDSP